MRVTQQDIARLAQVSQATVSRVMAGDGRVEVALRDKVLETAKLHNYRPDARARSLRKKNSGLVGLAIQRPEGSLSGDPFFTSLIAELLDALAPHRYQLCLDLVKDSEHEVAVYDDMLRSRKVDGLILVESVAHDSRLELLQRDRFPFVLIGNPMNSRVWSVDNDNVHAGELAASHLVGRGYSRIGMIAGKPGITVSEDRILGFSRSVSEVQEGRLVWHSEFGIEAAKSVAVEALRSHHSPDALVVLDDFMAMGVVLAAREEGRNIPDDLGLVSFNDTSFCHVLEYGLTSVSLNIPQLVNHAVESLMQQISGRAEERPRRTIVPAVLVERGSSQPSWRFSRALTEACT